jgi:hypothetical protein
MKAMCTDVNGPTLAPVNAATRAMNSAKPLIPACNTLPLNA